MVRERVAITPENLPLFNISSHELYGVASRLVQNDIERKFLELILDEIQNIDKEGGKEEEVRGGEGGGISYLIRHL